MTATPFTPREYLRAFARRGAVILTSGALLGGIFAWHDPDYPVRFGPAT